MLIHLILRTTNEADSVLIPMFNKWENYGTGELNNLPKVIQWQSPPIPGVWLEYMLLAMYLFRTRKLCNTYFYGLFEIVSEWGPKRSSRVKCHKLSCFYLLILLRCNLYTIKCIHFKCYSSMSFDKCILSHNYHPKKDVE